MIGNNGMENVDWVGAMKATRFQETLAQRRSANDDDNEKRFVSSQPTYDDEWKTGTIAVLRDVQMKRMYCARISASVARAEHCNRHRHALER